MVESSLGANSVCCEGTLGAGATMGALREGAVRDRFAETLGAGGMTLVARVGPACAERNPSAGGGPGMDLKARRLATASDEAGSFRLGASTTF